LASTQDTLQHRKIPQRIAKDKVAQRFGSPSPTVLTTAWCAAAIWLEFEPILHRIDG
jgi:hypothetical protein